MITKITDSFGEPPSAWVACGQFPTEKVVQGGRVCMEEWRGGNMLYSIVYKDGAFQRQIQHKDGRPDEFIKLHPAIKMTARCWFLEEKLEEKTTS